MTTSLMERSHDPVVGPPALVTHFAVAEDGLPVYLGETDDDFGEDWDAVSNDVTRNLWQLAAIAASIVTKYGEGNISRFAYEHRTSASWIRKLAKTYRAFENNRRISILSFYHHLEASTAKNPVRALKIANDREMSTRELKRWIYMGEGRNQRQERNQLPPAPSANDKPVTITVEPEKADDDDDQEDISIEDEEVAEEDRSLLLADLQLGLRMCSTALGSMKTRYLLRYIENLQQELDWELEQLTKSATTLADRVESLIRGGCWIPAQIMQRAKINSMPELNRICQKLEKEGKVKWSRERKRKHGTAPEMWMPSDMPDGNEFEVARSSYEPDVEYGEKE